MDNTNSGTPARSASPVHIPSPQSISSIRRAVYSASVLSDVSSTRIYIDVAALESIKEDVKVLKQLAAAHRSESGRHQFRHDCLLVIAIALGAILTGVALAARQATGDSSSWDTVVVVLSALQSCASILSHQLQFQAKAKWHATAAAELLAFVGSLQAQVITASVPAHVYEATRDSVRRIMHAYPWPPAARVQQDEAAVDFMEGLDVQKFIQSKYKLNAAKAQEAGRGQVADADEWVGGRLPVIGEGGSEV